MEHVERTIISQYANSATLVQLIENLNTYLDPRPLFDQFYDLVWNIDTAQGYGLDVWGRIVGVERTLTINTPPTYFGFYDSLGDSTSRSTPATYFDIAGVLQTAAPYQLRYTFDARGNQTGMLLEPAATNWIPNPRAEG